MFQISARDSVPYTAPVSTLNPPATPLSIPNAFLLSYKLCSLCELAVLEVILAFSTSLLEPKNDNLLCNLSIPYLTRS